MRKVWTAFSMMLLTVTFAAFPCAVPGRADSTNVSPQTPQEQQMVREQIARGELVSVDTDNNTLTIRTANDQEMQFNYDSNTKVEGTENGVQGLSTQTGNQLVIHYREGDNGQKIATRIEVFK